MPAKRKRLKGAKLNPRQKREVKRIVGTAIESKYVDTAVLLSPSSSGVLQLVSVPSQGTQQGQRSSDTIKLQKMMMRLNFASSDTSNVMRIVVFRWNVDNLITTPSVSDVLYNLATVSPMAHYNYPNLEQNKFAILFDKTYALSEQGRPSVVLVHSLYGKKLGKKKLAFNAGAITGKGQIYMLFISDSAGVPHPGVGGYVRLMYEDA